MINQKTQQWLNNDKSLFTRIDNLKSVYQDIFAKNDKTPTTENFIITCAPGRAEIIGNHTDYNEGYTLSTNISQNLLLVGKPNSSNKIEITSLNEDNNIVGFHLASIHNMIKQKSKQKVNDSWSNYVKGVMWAFLKIYDLKKGFKAVIQSTVPSGGGVSSSAALELATAYFICAVNRLNIPDETLISICKDAENNYVGAPCGFLDQATIALADNSMLFISYRQVKTRPFTWNTINLNLQNHNLSFIIGYDLKSKHSLVEGKYAVRQNACKKSISVLEQVLKRKVKALRDVNLDEFTKLKPDIFSNTSIPYKWILHVVSENQRVIDAKKAIEQKSMQAFGNLLTESGKSAIYDYELTEDSPELAFLYETILKNKKAWGIIGTRNMGGGFNATTLSLVRLDKGKIFKESLKNIYYKKFGSNYQFLQFTPSPAAGVIDFK